MKHSHEFRDPIHTFITVRSDERKVINSRPFQRLRHIHQLALTYFVYPGATHKRFEHSLGVMHLASQIFDIITSQGNIHSNIQYLIPDEDSLRYWRSVIRMAALCHDIGHLPFSHAAEHKLLPVDWDHERITKELILSDEMKHIWQNMTPPLRPEDVVRLAIGVKKAPDLRFSIWETILSEVIVGDSFGADRMDYLLRDSYRAGVQYGRFDHNRLINSIRILPTSEKGSAEPALGIEQGGKEAAESLILARYFIYKQVYFHHIRRVYDIHLIDFLQQWLPEGRFRTDNDGHLMNSDAEVIAAIRQCAADPALPAHDPASRIQNRNHFRRVFSSVPGDKEGAIIQPGKALYDRACAQFDPAKLRYDYVPPKVSSPDFPVLLYDGTVASCLSLSQVMENIPTMEVDSIYCCNAILPDVRQWLEQNKNQILALGGQEKLI
ncbi:MAG: HD domain-containing protein [Beijerinckiaceae bacterium]|nr:HD domain-containing protein [Beijerinckiaceae bacterium]